jgi:hypothetical protein
MDKKIKLILALLIGVGIGFLVENNFIF